MTTRTTSPVQSEITDAEAVHALKLGSVFGIPAIYTIVVLIGLAARMSMIEALLLAAWPAIVAGPFFGTLAVVGVEARDHERNARHAVVVPITEGVGPSATTARAA